MGWHLEAPAQLIAQLYGLVWQHLFISTSLVQTCIFKNCFLERHEESGEAAGSVWI